MNIFFVFPLKRDVLCLKSKKKVEYFQQTVNLQFDQQCIIDYVDRSFKKVQKYKKVYVINRHQIAQLYFSNIFFKPHFFKESFIAMTNENLKSYRK